MWQARDKDLLRLCQTVCDTSNNGWWPHTNHVPICSFHSKRKLERKIEKVRNLIALRGFNIDHIHRHVQCCTSRKLANDTFVFLWRFWSHSVSFRTGENQVFDLLSLRSMSHSLGDWQVLSDYFPAKNVKRFTRQDAHEQDEEFHIVQERADHESEARSEPAQCDSHSTAKSSNQDTRQWTWKVKSQSEEFRKITFSGISGHPSQWERKTQNVFFLLGVNFSARMVVGNKIVSISDSEPRGKRKWKQKDETRMILLPSFCTKDGFSRHMLLLCTGVLCVNFALNSIGESCQLVSIFIHWNPNLKIKKSLLVTLWKGTLCLLPDAFTCHHTRRPPNRSDCFWQAWMQV